MVKAVRRGRRRDRSENRRHGSHIRRPPGSRRRSPCLHAVLRASQAPDGTQARRPACSGVERDRPIQVSSRSRRSRQARRSGSVRSMTAPRRRSCAGGGVDEGRERPSRQAVGLGKALHDPLGQAVHHVRCSPSQAGSVSPNIGVRRSRGRLRAGVSVPRGQFRPWAGVPTRP